MFHRQYIVCVPVEDQRQCEYLASRHAAEKDAVVDDSRIRVT